MSAVKPNNHSLVEERDGRVNKIIESEAHFTEEEAARWALRVQRYGQLLQAKGVPVPSHHRIEVICGSLVVEEASHCGLDVQAALSQATIQPQEALTRILHALAGIFSQGNQPEVGIDPHPANWCLNNAGALTFVDFFPPYFVENRVPLVGFPQPVREDEQQLNLTRYYTMLGLVRLLRFNFARICGAQIEPMFLRVVEEILGKEIIERLRLCPVEQIRRDRQALRNIVSQLTILNVDDVREIAMVVSQNGNQPTLSDRVLRLTTVDFRIPRQVREERFAEAKTLLLAGY